MIRKKTWLWFQPISFQIIWLLTVLGGNQLIAFAIGLVCIHYWFSPHRKKDLLMLPIALIGFSLDLMLMQQGFFQFTEWPYWLLVLWTAFVLNFGHSLSFLRAFKSPALMFIGAIGGCYAYWASWKLGAVEWPQDALITCAVIAALWAVILPAAVRIEGVISQKVITDDATV